MKLGLAAVPCFVVLALAQDWPMSPGVFLFSFSAGFTVGLAELFVLKRWLKGLAFGLHLVVKSLLLVAVMYMAFAVLNLLDVAIEGITWQAYANTMFSREIFVAIIEGFVIITLLLFFVHLDRLLGPGVLLGYVTGRYHHPRREERVFMFLDMKGSTTLAEQMQADRYFSFLNMYFSEMSEPILATEAEIYQYVGDEVVLTWNLASGLQDGNCVQVFFWIKDQMESRRAEFLQKFGVVPEFKAGVHCGEVITAQIGELKSEIVYNGDVLNTTARIQAKCNELGHELLISSQLAHRLQQRSTDTIIPLGAFPLRGKQEPVELCAVERTGSISTAIPQGSSRRPR